MRLSKDHMRELAHSLSKHIEKVEGEVSAVVVEELTKGYRVGVKYGSCDRVFHVENYDDYPGAYQEMIRLCARYKVNGAMAT